MATLTGRLPAVVALATGAALAVVLLLPVPARGPAGNGAAFLVTAYAEALAVAGLGMALARAPLRPALSGVLLFAAGLLAGWAVKDRVLAALVERPGAFEYTGFIAPAGCVLTGAALAVSATGRRAVAVAVALPIGAGAGFLSALNDPTLGQSHFVAGAAVAAFWLLLAPCSLLPHAAPAFAVTAARILASWLVAIGLMLGAAKGFGPRASDPAARPAPPPIGAALRASAD